MSWVRRLGRFAGIGAIVAVASACGPPIYNAACQNKLTTSTAGPITDVALNEISGIHAGVRNPGIWWVHNDSGDTNRIFALDQSGTVRGVYTLTGASAIDWEDIAVVPGPTEGSGSIHVGDIGDNPGNRAQIQVYRVSEPAVPLTGPAANESLPAETLRFTYPDGPRDAEALMVDPVLGDVLVVSKNFNGGSQFVYRAPAGLPNGSTTVLTKVHTIKLAAGLGNAITAADVSAAGDVVALRTYGAVRLYQRPRNQGLWLSFKTQQCSAPQPAEGQGEAVGFSADAKSVATVGEGTNRLINIATAPAS